MKDGEDDEDSEEDGEGGYVLKKVLFLSVKCDKTVRSFVYL